MKKSGISPLSKDLTSGNEFVTLIKFSLPFLLSSFLQTFYGLADLFITGLYEGAVTISAVSIGSQLMHMLTVIISGLAMGTTVSISRALGLKDKKSVEKIIKTSVIFFLVFSVVFGCLLVVCSDIILKLLSTPEEAFYEAGCYSVICFVGVPLITIYNIISCIFRGLGDSKSPMLFVFIAGIFNILLDFVFIGKLNLGAGGAALATVISQGISVVLAVLFLVGAMKKNKAAEKSCSIVRNYDKNILRGILKIGVPVACQDGLIQISFLVITAIANTRGVEVAASVGIVEKIICFLFLVPSAMLSSISAIAAQNLGAGRYERSVNTLRYGILICIIFGIIVSVLCNIFSEEILSVFAKNDKCIIELGTQYLVVYVTDCIFAGIHFCFSGFFCACGKSMYSFMHNIISITLIRIPGAYFASIYYPDSLFPMGMAAPLGSLLSSVICIILFVRLKPADVINYKV